MNQRPLFFDTFRIDVATGETTLHREQDEPGDTVLLDRDGRPTFSHRARPGRHRRDQRDRPGHRRSAAPASRGRRRAPDGRATATGHRRRERAAHRLLPGRRRPATGPHRPRDRGGDRHRRRRRPRPRHQRHHAARRTATRRVHRPAHRGGPRGPVRRRPPAHRGRRPALRRGPRPAAEAVRRRLGTLSSDESGQRWVVTFVHDRDPGVTWFYDHTTGDARLLFRAYPNRDPNTWLRWSPSVSPPATGCPCTASSPSRSGSNRGTCHWCWWCTADRGTTTPGATARTRSSSPTGATPCCRSTSAAPSATAAGTSPPRSASSRGRCTTTSSTPSTWAVTQGYADPDRIGIYGGSYGGYAALIGVTVTPDRFAAAVDYVGVSDLANFLRTLPPFGRAYFVNNWYRYVGDPEIPEQEADMLARSPITMVDRIRTPLLVAQGANDVRVLQDRVRQHRRVAARARSPGRVPRRRGRGPRLRQPREPDPALPRDRTALRRTPRRPPRRPVPVMRSARPVPGAHRTVAST